MIYIFTALYCEAHPLIRIFELVRNHEQNHFQVFENKDAGIILTVTGAGSIKAAVAVSSIGTGYGIRQEDFLINIGTCGNLAEDVCTDFTGKIYLCNKITEKATGRTFYPDILFCHEFYENEIVSSEKTVCRGFEGNNIPIPAGCGQHGLADMEAAAVYQAGAYFFAPHRMSFLKIVSDNGNPENVTAERVEELVERNAEQIMNYIQRLQEWCRTESRAAEPVNEEEKAWLEKVYSDMHCSDTMKAMLNQHVHYCILTGKDYKHIIQEYYLQGKLPCSSKREGKLYFEELRKRLF